MIACIPGMVSWFSEGYGVYENKRLEAQQMVVILSCVDGLLLFRWGPFSGSMFFILEDIRCSIMIGAALKDAPNSSERWSCLSDLPAKGTFLGFQYKDPLDLYWHIP